MNVMVWFYEHRELLYDMMDKRALEDLRKEYKGSEDELEELEYNVSRMWKILRCEYLYLQFNVVVLNK